MIQNQTAGEPSARLEPVDLRKVWTHEADRFTPWLAQPDNLDLLGESLGITLEVDAVEKSLGSFRADIVCREESGSTVVIENQLERTNHDHLGKLLTYAASLKAATVVWLAATFREEHRAVLDWLNQITPEDYRFFGVEIEVWRIGKSPVAPKFNVVSMPNDWSKSVAATVVDARPSAGRLKQLEYWSRFQDVLDTQDGWVSRNRKPQAKGYMTYPIGRTGFHLAAVMNTQEKWVRAELYIHGSNAAEILLGLERDRDQVEHELGYKLEWGDQSPTARDRRIGCKLRDADPKEESDWSRQHEWLATHLKDLYGVFVERVRSL